VLESRRVRAVDREMLRHQPVRADLDLGLVLDIDRGIAGETRSHEQRDIVAPRYERPLEQPTAGLAAALHEGVEALRIAGLEGDPARHVDPANSQAVLMQWWMSRSSMSRSLDAAARWNRSPSPVQSIVTLARIASRPSLLSNTTPPTRPSPSSIGAAAQACSTRCTRSASTISWLNSFRFSGSTEIGRASCRERV